MGKGTCKSQSPENGLACVFQAMGSLFSFITFFTKDNYLLAVLGLHCCMGLSSCRERSCSPAAAHGPLTVPTSLLQSSVSGRAGFRGWSSRTRAQAESVWHTGLVVPQRGIFRDQGLNPGPLHWQMDSLSPSHQRSPLGSILNL